MHRQHALFMRAMSAAVEAAAGLHPVANNFAATVLAFRGQGVNRAFETVEIMGNPVYHNFNGFVVLVSANFTSLHILSFLVFFCYLS